MGAHFEPVYPLDNAVMIGNPGRDRERLLAATPLGGR